MSRSDMSYAFPNGRDADSRVWGSEKMFYAGLGAVETEGSELVTVTPSGATTTQAEVPWYQAMLQTAVPLLSTAYQQNQMTKLNIARINQGMPPLSANQYAAVYQPPSAQVQVGPTAGATNMLLWIGGGVALLVGLRAAKII